MGRGRRVEDTRSWVGALVASGLTTAEELRRQVVEAIAADLRVPDPGALADAWIAGADQEWRARAATWAAVTDHDRLQRAFGTMESADVVVLQGCADHWAARDALLRSGRAPRGIAWFTAPDVWHAVTEGMLEVNLWHSTTANAAPGDALLDEVLAAFAEAGLEAHFDEGRVEVAARWQRRPA